MSSCSNKSLAMRACARRDACAKQRLVALPLGPRSHNPLDCSPPATRSLRALYGSDGTRNAVHGSDSATSAAREARFFFPKLCIPGASRVAGGSAQDAEAMHAYVAEKLQPTLVKALTALAKAKPSSDKAR